jgi:uncharacterized cupin superfamily protein
MLFVLSGEVWLRDAEGWRELPEGEIVSFPPGPAGAHQLVNRGTRPARLLAVSTNGAPDIVIYPDSDKLGANERLPEGGGLSELYRRSDSVGYWDGESPPHPPA